MSAMVMPHFMRNHDLRAIIPDGWAEPPLEDNDLLYKISTISDGVVYFAIHRNEVANDPDSGADIEDHKRVIFKSRKDRNPPDRRRWMHRPRCVAEIDFNGLS